MHLGSATHILTHVTAILRLDEWSQSTHQVAVSDWLLLERKLLTLFIRCEPNLPCITINGSCDLAIILHLSVADTGRNYHDLLGK